MHIAASNGYQSVVEFLLKKKVSMDLIDNDAWQPVHCAAFWRHLGVVELLLSRGARTDAITSSGRTLQGMCHMTTCMCRATSGVCHVTNCMKSSGHTLHGMCHMTSSMTS